MILLNHDENRKDCLKDNQKKKIIETSFCLSQKIHFLFTTKKEAVSFRPINITYKNESSFDFNLT